MDLLFALTAFMIRVKYDNVAGTSQKHTYRNEMRNITAKLSFKKMRL